MRSLLKDGTLCGAARLLGNHWGGVTACMRALGTKCGQRVFWPGSGLEVVEYDLLSVGDDCVFGSRSTFMCGDALENAPIELRAGSNVADRCVLLPGVTLGTNACLGSGALAAKSTTYGPGCVTVGSWQGETVVLDEGSAAAEAAGSRKAFGRTFYGSKADGTNTATWRVPAVPAFVAWVWLCNAFAIAYRASQIVLAWLLLDVAHGGREETTAHFTGRGRRPRFTGRRGGGRMLGDADEYEGWSDSWAGFGWYVGALFGMYLGVHLAMVLGAYMLDIGAKWLFMGRRAPGVYPWDTSTYCFRWNCCAPARFELATSCSRAPSLLTRRLWVRISLQT